MAQESGRGDANRSIAGTRRNGGGSKPETQREPAVAQPSASPREDERVTGSRSGRPLGAPPPVTNTVSHLPSNGDREAHRRRVAEAAYYRAQRRGFTPGGEVDDWLEAEKEIANSESGTDK